MQRQYQAVHYLVHSAVAGLCYVVVTQMNWVDALISDFPLLQKYKIFELSIIPIIAVLLQQSDRLARLIVGGIPILSPALRRLLAGREHIEGHWPLVVIDAQSGDLVFYGFLTIRHKTEGLHVEGNDWFPDGQHALWFQSVQARFQDQLLQYWYEQGTNRTKPTMRGYTEMYFFPDEGPITRHAGEFLDKEHNYRFYARRRKFGWRDTAPATDAERIAAADLLWQDLQKDLPRITKQSISKDWI